MSTLPTLIAKARAAGRPVVDALREWGAAGCPEFDAAHPFWVGVQEKELESFADWRELQAATAQIAAERGAADLLK